MPVPYKDVISVPFLNGWQQIKSMDQWIPFCDTHPFDSLCIVHPENYHGYSTQKGLEKVSPLNYGYPLGN